ncbi:WavE lipopolysaccharide synthesis family protein [Cronobacter dublinensis]
MPNISVVFCGVRYPEYDIYYAAKNMRNIFPGCELILSTNDASLTLHAEQNNFFDKVVHCKNTGELPSLKYPENKKEKLINNNIKKQIDTSRAGIEVASNELILKLRTDQIIVNDDILKLWNLVKDIPLKNKKYRNRIITSSVFSINPRYSERMPYHLSDMLQFGMKEDLLSYYSAPEYPFAYAIWYEKHSHAKNSNNNERKFRSRFAVEQWLLLNYIFENEQSFPINYHNHHSPKIIKEFEALFTDYFLIAHPDDIGLRASKFEPNMSYVNNQCYSTHECLRILQKNNCLSEDLAINYKPKGINKKFYKQIKIILDLKIVQLLIKNIPYSLKENLKKMIS